MPKTIEFRHRAHEVSRVEAFSDVVFGFAISLLVVSLEAPTSYDEMMHVLHGFLPFAICFLLFIGIWFEHHRFYKRYATISTLSSASIRGRAFTTISSWGASASSRSSSRGFRRAGPARSTS